MNQDSNSAFLPQFSTQAARPGLQRSEHGAEGTEWQARIAVTESPAAEDGSDAFVFTVHDIENDLEEVPLSAVFEEETPPPTAGKDTSPVRKGQFWIHVQVTGKLDDALPVLDEQLWEPLRLPRFLKRHLRNTAQWQTTQVVPLHNAAWIVMRILGGFGGVGSGDDAFKYTTTQGVHSVRHAAAICLPCVLVTVTVLQAGTQPQTHPHIFYGYNRKITSLWGDARQAEASLARLTQERELPEATVTGCLIMWLSYHVGRTQAAASALRQRVYQLVEQDHDSGGSDILSCHEDIIQAKDTLLRLGAIAEEQNEGIEAVEQGDAVTSGWSLQASSLHVQGSLRVTSQAAASTERMLQRLEKRVADLEQRYDAAQQSTINQRLQALTILSAVFLPLTLMAGVWGMNFSEMPELQRPHAYYFALASMAGVATTLLVFFYRNGWLN